MEEHQMPTFFRYALGQRIWWGANRTIAFIIVRRRYDEGEVSSFAEYALLPASPGIDPWTLWSSAWAGEADIMAVEEGEEPC